MGHLRKKYAEVEKNAQIAGSELGTGLWYHGTDSISAYEVMKDMYVKPRQETGETSYTGGLSSIPTNVYLTSYLPKAIKHAIERAASYKSQPVILVIRPQDLGYVHVDEDFVHMMLLGKTLWDNSEWYPSPKLEKEIFEMADDITRASDYYPDSSVKNAVRRYFIDKQMGWSDDDVEDEYLKEEGIVPDEGGYYEYDEAMHAAKEIATALNNKHQKQAIIGFQNLAHVGQVRAYEIYLVPHEINLAGYNERDYWVDPRVIMTYDALRKYCEKIDPHQLVMSFMRKGGSVGSKRKKFAAKDWRRGDWIEMVGKVFDLTPHKFGPFKQYTRPVLGQVSFMNKAENIRVQFSADLYPMSETKMHIFVTFRDNRPSVSTSLSFKGMEDYKRMPYDIVQTVYDMIDNPENYGDQGLDGDDPEDNPVTPEPTPIYASSKIASSQPWEVRRHVFEGSPWMNAETSQPISLFVYRGEGGGDYGSTLENHWQNRLGREHLLGRGIYFAPTPRIASHWGKPDLYKVTLNNPYVLEGANMQTMLSIDPDQIRNAGYDGIIIKSGQAGWGRGQENMKQLMVFPQYSSQIQKVESRPIPSSPLPGATVKILDEPTKRHIMMARDRLGDGDFQEDKLQAIGKEGLVTSLDAWGNPNVRINRRVVSFMRDEVIAIGGDHRTHVQEALQRGDQVPPEVLEDYPDLKVSTKTAATLDTQQLPDKLTQAIQYEIGGKWDHTIPHPYTKAIEDILGQKRGKDYSTAFWISCKAGEPITNQKWGVYIEFTVSSGLSDTTFDSSTGDWDLNILADVQLAFASSWTQTSPYALLNKSVGYREKMKTIQEVAQFVKETIINSQKGYDNDDDDDDDDDDRGHGKPPPEPAPTPGVLEPVMSNWHHNYRKIRTANRRWAIERRRGKNELAS